MLLASRSTELGRDRRAQELQLLDLQVAEGLRLISLLLTKSRDGLLFIVLVGTSRRLLVLAVWRSSNAVLDVHAFANLVECNVLETSVLRSRPLVLTILEVHALVRVRLEVIVLHGHDDRGEALRLLLPPAHLGLPVARLLLLFKECRLGRGEADVAGERILVFLAGRDLY